MSDVLKMELETFKKLLPQLAADQGKHALIHEDKLVGVYESYADALKIGYEKFGVHPFLVKRISATNS